MKKEYKPRIQLANALIDSDICASSAVARKILRATSQLWNKFITKNNPIQVLWMIFSAHPMGMVLIPTKTFRTDKCTAIK